MAMSTEARYNELAKRSKKDLYEQYRRVMQEHDKVVNAYDKVTKDDMIFFIVFYA